MRPRLRKCPTLPGCSTARVSSVSGVSSQAMKRLFLGVTSIYGLFAVIGRFVEGMGAVRCGCRPDCWCQKPVLSAFRWVFPAGHSLGADCS